MKPIVAAKDGEFLHTFEKGCWYLGKHPRAYAPRKGHHPRDPAMPATGDPNAGQRGDAGIETELSHDAARSERHAAAASSSSGERPPMVEGSEPLSMGRHKTSKQERRSGVSGTSKVPEVGSVDDLFADLQHDPDDRKLQSSRRVNMTFPRYKPWRLKHLERRFKVLINCLLCSVSHAADAALLITFCIIHLYAVLNVRSVQTHLCPTKALT